jgi:thymidylate synthase
MKHFGYDQFAEHRVQKNKLICVWDPSTDGDNFGEHNPCLVTVRFKEVGKWLDVVVTYRKRDLLTRMVGNLLMVSMWLNSEASVRKLKPGLITDFSMEVQYDEGKLAQHLKKKEKT